MEIGRLRHVIELQKRVEVGRNPDYGDIIYGWETQAKVWATINMLSGKDFIAASATQSKVTGQFIVRYYGELKPSMRIKHNDKLYNIVAVMQDGITGQTYQRILVSLIEEGY